MPGSSSRGGTGLVSQVEGARVNGRCALTYFPRAHAETSPLSLSAVLCVQLADSLPLRACPHTPSQVAPPVGRLQLHPQSCTRSSIYLLSGTGSRPHVHFTRCVRVRAARASWALSVRQYSARGGDAVVTQETCWRRG